MAPSSILDDSTSDVDGSQNHVHQLLGDSHRTFASYRQMVPLVASGNATYLNASLAPPSNLILHDAITSFAHQSLHDPAPKATWQKSAAHTKNLLARYIHAESAEDVALMRDTTEGLNSFIRGLRFKEGDNVVLLDSEHPNHAYAWMALRASGLEVRQVPTIAAAEKEGRVTAATAETFRAYVDDRTVAIGLSSVMFHSGQWNDVAGIAAAYRPQGIHIVADITQQVGFAQVDVVAMGVSAAAFSLHKGLNCPTGLAALYVSPEVIKSCDPSPPIVGYGAIQNARADLLVPDDPLVYHPSARRYEHLNLSLIATTAAEAFLKFYLDVMGPEAVQQHLYALGDTLRSECEKLGVAIIGPTNRAEHAPHLYVLDLHGPRWLEHLKSNRVYVTGYRLGIRVSFGYYNSSGDVYALTSVLKSGIDAGLPRGKQ